MSTRTTPALGVLNVDGLHLYGQLVVPVANALRPVGDLCLDARRARLQQRCGPIRGRVHEGAASAPSGRGLRGAGSLLGREEGA